ncbi:hypothetical protein LPJ64_002677 [Coemansia asiatica]|uniref:Uncharacterized protein n=1 Tax=Coemansia asiatica TaxID=1052880 RepID=A0A9W8CKT8_9FUNG|nr:hypothetical protein LPJ64_002677 [Coemansia asiatica]
MGNSMTKQQPEQSLGLHKFRLLQVIGRGSFGKVRMVEHRETNKAYALKYINKATCIGMKSHHNTIRERDMLEEIDHPFIVNLRFSFQDEFSMYVVMDLMIGGDLRFHMMRRRFVEGVIRFWIAELACAIDHLHRNHKIVHRDIKPDNILIDDQGHVALTDFNIATRIKGGQMHYSVAGTANYMAPEVVSGVGYTYSVDWWSLGVVMYECVYGKRPFRHKKTNDQLKRALMQEEIQFPIIADVQVSFDCISAMRGFLQKDPSQRLGCGPNGLDNVKSHPFFASINWPLLEAKQLDPPFAPSSDESNFDISHDLEEMLLEPAPLDPKRRVAMKKHQTPTEHETQEYHDITAQFAAFDYIEYERFKAYIDAYGSIDAIAVDAARAAASVTQRSSASTDNSMLTPTLAQLKLDGRLMINPDPKACNSFNAVANISAAAASSTPSSSFGRSRTSTTHMANSSRTESKEAQFAQHQYQQQQQKLHQHQHTGSNTSISATTNVVMSSLHYSSSSAALLTAMCLNEPCLVEPPSIVPIDVATWNQLLPEQRSLAHRYCVKMAHDRRRMDYIEERKGRINTNPYVSFPAASSASASSAAAGPAHFMQGQRAPMARLISRSVRPSVDADETAMQRVTSCNSLQTTDSSSSNNNGSSGNPIGQDANGSWLGPNSRALLTAREKRKSLMKRQHSADNLSLLTPGSPLNAGPGQKNQQNLHLNQQLRQKYHCTEMSFSDLPSSALRNLPSPYAHSSSSNNPQYTGSRDFSEENRNESEHYLHQPLPPPPPPPPQSKLPESLTKYQRVSPAMAPLSIPLTPVSDGRGLHRLGTPAHLMEHPANSVSASYESDSSYLTTLR